MRYIAIVAMFLIAGAIIGTGIVEAQTVSSLSHCVCCNIKGGYGCSCPSCSCSHASGGHTCNCVNGCSCCAGMK